MAGKFALFEKLVAEGGLDDEVQQGDRIAAEVVDRASTERVDHRLNVGGIPHVHRRDRPGPLLGQQVDEALHHGMGEIHQPLDEEHLVAHGADEFVGGRHRRGERLLGKHRLAGCGRCRDHVVVGVVGRADVDHVDVGIGDGIGETGAGASDAVPLSELRNPARISPRDQCDPRTRRCSDGFGDCVGDEPRADDRPAQLLCHRLRG